LQDEFVEEDASFKPMEQDDLHMTILFLGVRLRRRDKEKMDKINEIILEYLADTDLTPWFKNPRLMRFPPGKNNLVVIEYEIDKETERFVKGLRKKLSEFLGIDYEEEWIPHITIGKMRYPNKHCVNRKVANNFFPDTITLCGRKVLDPDTWHF